jgi:hypothetical protein
MKELYCGEGSLKMRAHSVEKTVKYNLLVRMMCEKRRNFICNMEIYTAERKKMEGTIIFVIGDNL